MSWRQRFADWVAPKAAKVAGQVEAAVDEAKDRAVVVVQTQAPGMSRRLVLSLLALILLLLSVGGYAIYWLYLRPVKQLAGLVPVQTQGGEKTPGYTGKEIKGLGKVPSRTTTRPVQTTPVAELPAKEQGFAPVVAPVVGPDNVVRKDPELLTSSVVPPWRGDTEVRTWLNPDGSAQNVLTPRNEPFFGFTPKRGAIGVGYGVGAWQMAGRVKWEPLRLGNVFVTAEGMGGMRTDGRTEGSVMGWVEYRFGR